MVPLYLRDGIDLMVAMTEGVELDLDALEAAGKADLARNQEALAKACEELTPGQGIEACVAAVAADKPEGGAVAGVAQHLGHAPGLVADDGVCGVVDHSPHRTLLVQCPEVGLRGRSAAIAVRGQGGEPAHPRWHPSAHDRRARGVSRQLAPRG